MRHTFLLSLALLAGQSAICNLQSAILPYDPTSAYDLRILQGFRVYVNRKALAHEAETRDALTLLDEKLAEVARVVPAGHLPALRRIALWMEWENKPGGAAEYHLSAEWLREHGYNPEKARCVEISNVRNFVKWTRETQPMMILHELAHAYHHNVLGYDYQPILKDYDRAVKSGLYDSVAYVHGGKKRAYALNNAQEYFAELSECYFGKNDFFPFTRDDLRKYDPEAYALMVRAWGEVEKRGGEEAK